MLEIKKMFAILHVRNSINNAKANQKFHVGESKGESPYLSNALHWRVSHHSPTLIISTMRNSFRETVDDFIKDEVNDTSNSRYELQQFLSFVIKLALTNETFEPDFTGIREFCLLWQTIEDLIEERSCDEY